MLKMMLPAVIGLLLLACTTPEEPAPTATLDEMLLVNENGWSLQSEIKDDGVKKTDLALAYPACVRDDQFLFFSDYTYSIAEGASRCTITDPTIKVTGTWKFASGVLTLTPSTPVSQPFTFATASTSFGLKELSADRWIYTYLEMTSGGTVASTTTVTMTPIIAQ